MPVCYITLSESFKNNFIDFKQYIDDIRDIVANGLDSKSRLLDRNHISIRIQTSNRENMLADIEIDIFAQFFWRRFFSRDKRANLIARNVSTITKADCAAWINLTQVGYSRHTQKGKDYYSVKEDNAILFEQRKKNTAKTIRQ